jgi:hypothetical protein
MRVFFVKSHEKIRKFERVFFAHQPEYFFQKNSAAFVVLKNGE